MCDRCGKPIRTWGLRHEAEPIRVATPGDDGLAGGTGPVDREIRRREAEQSERNRSAYGIDPANLKG
jgi:hypothetical protein